MRVAGILLDLGWIPRWFVIVHVSGDQENHEELVWSCLALALHSWFRWVSSACSMLIWLKWYYTSVIWYVNLPRRGCTLPPSSSFSCEWMIIVKWIYMTCTCTWKCFNSWALSGRMYHTLFGWEVPFIPTQCYERVSVDWSVVLSINHAGGDAPTHWLTL